MQPVNFPPAKKIFDIVISLVLLIVLSPAILLIVLAFACEAVLVRSSRGPILYSETRISQGKPFILYKFRIFKVGVLKSLRHSGKFIHTKELEKNRNNFTYLGRFLKQVYMDELPQFFNVLRGDISLVGPRPTNSVNAARWLSEGKYSKHLIKGGVTGYFQSYKGVKLDRDQNEADMEYISYCRNNPGWKVVLLDAKILIISVITVIKAEGI